MCCQFDPREMSVKILFYNKRYGRKNKLIIRSRNNCGHPLVHGDTQHQQQYYAFHRQPEILTNRREKDRDYCLFSVSVRVDAPPFNTLVYTYTLYCHSLTRIYTSTRSYELYLYTISSTNI